MVGLEVGLVWFILLYSGWGMGGGFLFMREFLRAILKVVGLTYGVMLLNEFHRVVNVMEGDLLKNE